MDTNFSVDHVSEPSVTKRRPTNNDIFTHQSANKTFVPNDPTNDFIPAYPSDKDLLSRNNQCRVPSHDGSLLGSDEEPILNEPELDAGGHRMRPDYAGYNIYEDAPQVVENYSLYNTSASSLNEGEFDMECLDDREEVFDAISVDDTPALEEVNNLVYPSPQSDLAPIPNEIKAQGAYDWYINDWLGVKNIQKLHSDSFQIGEYRWRLLIFPQGNQSGVVQSMSVFLENEDCKAKAISVCAQFSLAIVSTIDPEVAYVKESHHRFIDPTSDWGFAKFIRIDELEKSSADLAPLSSSASSAYQKLGALLNDNRFIIRTHVRIVHDPIGNLWIDPTSYDSRRETGYVGIKNQGATCYMNSLLQSLFLMTAFQRSTFQIPTDVNEDQMARNIPLALQKFFYQLHVSPSAVSTKDLTRSFGWDSYESFLQQDIQELKAVLFDALEAKLKGTPGEHDLDNLFQIRSTRLTKCLHVDYESKSGSTCYDLPLEIKGLPNIQSSFEKYIEKETFEGNNQYKAEQHGYQDAVTGNIFTRFPPVLYLNLKRYDYDPMVDRISKINDYYEFPETLDLTPYYDPSVDAEPEKAGDPRQKQIFHLFGVLVHAGDFGGGHYYAFLRDLAKATKGGAKWMRFDDDRVYFASEEEAIQENYGGDGNIPNSGGALTHDYRTPQTRSDILRREAAKPQLSSLAARLKRVTSAYMLIYIREEDIPWVLAPFSVSNIPSKLSSLCEQERQDEIDRRAARMREQAQQKLFIITESMLNSNYGPDLFDHLFSSAQEKLLSKKINETAKTITSSVDEVVAPPELYVTTVLKSASIKDLKYHLQAEHGIAVEDQRLWLVTKKTAGSADGRRVGMLLDDRMPLTKVTDRSGSLTIYLEIATIDHPLPRLKDDSILIFIKLYDPRISKLSFVGTFTLTSEERLARDVIPKIRRKIGLPDNSPLLLFEEINRDKVKQFSTQELEKTVSAAVIQHGNILIVQPQVDMSNISAIHSVDDLSVTPILPTTIQYFAWLSKRLVLTMMLYQSSDFNSNLHEVFASQEKDKLYNSISGKEDGINQPIIDPPGTFYLQVSRDMTYATLSQMLYAALVGAYGNSVIASPEHLRFRGYDGILDAAKTVPFLYGPDVPLDELLSKTLYMQPTHRLYYEILDISLPLFQLKKPLRVSFVNQVSSSRSPIEMSPSTNPSLTLANPSFDNQLYSNSPNISNPSSSSPLPSSPLPQKSTNILDSRVVLVDDHDKLEHLLEKLHLKADLSNLYLTPSEDSLLSMSPCNSNQYLQKEYSEMNLEHTPPNKAEPVFRLLEIHPTHLWNVVGCYHEQDVVGHGAKDTNIFLLDRIPFEQQSEQLSKSDNLLVRVVHYHKDLRHSHALPSLFLIKPIESFVAMKARLRQHLATVLPSNLGVFSDKEWNRIQFTFASTMQPISSITEEDFIVPIGSTQSSSLHPFYHWFKSGDLKTDFLGLDYPSKLSSGKSTTSSSSPYEKGLKIHS